MYNKSIINNIIDLSITEFLFLMYNESVIKYIIDLQLNIFFYLSALENNKTFPRHTH